MNRRTIAPNSTFLKWWDAAIVFALLFTAIVTPFEVAFLTLYVGRINYTLNRVVDGIFLLDMIFTFFIPYRAASRDGGMWTYDNGKIAKNYLKGWFAIDLFTTIPIDVIMEQLAKLQGMQDASAGPARLLKVLRVAKIMRILRATRVVKRWEDHIGLSYAARSLCTFLITTVVMAHWLACVWGYVGNGEGSSWRTRLPPSMATTTDPMALYGVCLYVAFNNIFGGSCEINPTEPLEYYIQCLMMVLGSCVWAYVIGSAVGILATLDPASTEYRNVMDELNYFARDQRVPGELTVKLRGFMKQTQHLIRARRYDQLMRRMSTALRGDTSYALATRIFQKVSYFSDPRIEYLFLSALTFRIKIDVYSRLERIPTHDLTVIDRGVCTKGGCVRIIGTALSVDFLVSIEGLRDLSDAVALTFCQCYSISRTSVFELLPHFPEACKVIRRATFLQTFSRAIIKAARMLRSDPSRFGDWQLRSDGASVLQAATREALTSAPLLEMRSTLQPQVQAMLPDGRGAMRTATSTASAGASSPLGESLLVQHKQMLEEHATRLSAELSAQLSAGLGALERLLHANSVRRRLHAHASNADRAGPRSAAGDAAEDSIDHRMDERLADTADDPKSRVQPLHRRTPSCRTGCAGGIETVSGALLEA